MGDRLQMLKDMGINLYGLGENVASLGSAAIAEPVAGFAAMYDPVHGAQAIREGMTYQPRGESAKMYQKGVGDFVSKLVQPVMPVVDAWQKGVDIAGRYSPASGAALQTVPTALAALLGYKPAMQTGRQVSNGLDMLQRRVVANANAPRTLNAGYMGQRGAIGTQRPLTEFEQAHATAQRNAALPVNQGGLGLPADNTAMDRARAMGFDTEFQHGSGTGNITAFDLLETQKSDPGYLGQAIYGGPIGMKAYTGGGNVYPLLAKSENMQKITPENWNNNSPYSEVSDLFSKDFGNRDKIAQEYTKGKLNKGVTGIIDTSNGKGLEQIAVFDPKNIRSRFAAFDPFNRDSSNLLAQSAKLAPTAGIAAYLYGQQEKDKQ